MDFDFSPDTLMLRDLLRRFVQKEARPLEMKYFNTGALTADERAHLRTAIEQLGLWGVSVPEKFGGGGLDVVTTCLIEEELGHTIIPVELGEVPPLLFACAGEQVKNYLEPALAGQRRCLIAAREPKALRPNLWMMTAIVDGAEFILDGHKSIAWLPAVNDFLVVFAKTSEGLTAFLVDANQPGVSTLTNGEIVLILRDCRVGREALLGEPGRALTLGADEAPRAWIRMGARYVGIGERLLSMAAEHAKEWVALGAPLTARPAVQRLLAELRTEIESARWLVYHAAWLADKGESVREAATHVRLFTGDLLQRAITQITLIYTGPGTTPQVEPFRLAHSAVPSAALELTLESARAAIAATVLADIKS